MIIMLLYMTSIFFFFNDTATTEIYTLSLHDALPISMRAQTESHLLRICGNGLKLSVYPSGKIALAWKVARIGGRGDRKSTRLNSSHDQISYAVFCLKKKKRSRIHIKNARFNCKKTCC